MAYFALGAMRLECEYKCIQHHHNPSQHQRSHNRALAAEGFAGAVRTTHGRRIADAVTAERREKCYTLDSTD